MPQYDTPAQSSDGYVLGMPNREVPPPVYKRTHDPDPLGQEALKKMFAAMKTSAEEHKAPRKLIWDQCWAIYNNQYDWSQKAWWQHKAPIPKVRSSVDRAVALFRKTLLRMYPFYGIQSESKLGRTKGRYSMLLTDYWFDQIGIIDEMVTAFKVGLITSVSASKIWFARVRDFRPEVTTESYTEPTYEFGIQTGETARERRKVNLKEHAKGRLAVKAVNPYELWVVPGTNNRTIIERTKTTLSEVESLAEAGVYDSEALNELRDKLLSGPSQHSEDEEHRTHDEPMPSANQYLRELSLWHYWGDIYDTQGNLVMCDASFTLADEQILLRKARPNPFFHKEPPYVIGTPYTVPFSTYNRGMVEDIMEIAKSITEMANLIADGALYDAMKAFAIDADQLDDPSEARQGIYPGKTFIRRSSMASTPNEQIIQSVEVGRVPAEAMNMIALFEKYHQEGSYINEWVGGTGRAGGQTLGEVNIKTQSALEGLDEAARNLETTFIEPVVAMSTKVIYQYHENFMLQRLMDNYPQLSVMLQQLSAEERYATMITDFSFRVRGLSVMIDRAQRIGELKEILTLLSYLPGFLEQLDPQATLEEILMPIGWDPRRLLINPPTGIVGAPTAGAQPQPQATPPPGTVTAPPMQVRNAAEGARLGGSRDNPMARGRGGLQMLPPQLLMAQGRVR